MRNLAIASFLALSATPAAAAESMWEVLELTRILAPSCPEEYAQVYGDMDPAQLGRPIAIIRARETEYAARVGSGGDLKAAEKAMDAFALNLAGQAEQGLKRLGCKGAFQALGLASPRRVDHATLMRAVERMPLPSSARGDDIPEGQRIGTEANIGLQRVILGTMATPNAGCEPGSAKVTPVSRAPLAAENAPPYVGKLERFEERWDLVCKGEPTAFKVVFNQDARNSRFYAVQTIKKP